MNAWIESIAELMNTGRSQLHFSFSDARFLIPDSRICCVVALAAIFCFVNAWENRRQIDGHDHKRDVDSKEND